MLLMVFAGISAAVAQSVSYNRNFDDTWTANTGNALVIENSDESFYMLQLYRGNQLLSRISKDGIIIGQWEIDLQGVRIAPSDFTFNSDSTALICIGANYFSNLQGSFYTMVIWSIDLATKNIAWMKSYDDASKLNDILCLPKEKVCYAAGVVLNVNSNDAVLLKIPEDGVGVEKVKQINVQGFENYTHLSVDRDNPSSVYVYGRLTQGNVGNSTDRFRAVASKIDLDLNHLWSTTLFNNSSQRSRNYSRGGVVRNDTVYVSGFTELSSNRYDFRLSALTSDGQHIWTKKYDGFSLSNAWGMRGVQELHDGILVFGNTYSLANGLERGLMLLKINFSGEVVWFKAYGSVSGSDLSWQSPSSTVPTEFVVETISRDILFAYSDRPSRNATTAKIGLLRLDSLGEIHNVCDIYAVDLPPSVQDIAVSPEAITFTEEPIDTFKTDQSFEIVKELKVGRCKDYLKLESPFDRDTIVLRPCDARNLQLQVEGGESYLWQYDTLKVDLSCSQCSTTTALVRESTTINVIGFKPEMCCEITDTLSLTIIVQPVPDFELVSDDTLYACPGDSFTVSVKYPSEDLWDIFYQDKSGNFLNFLDINDSIFTFTIADSGSYDIFRFCGGQVKDSVSTRLVYRKTASFFDTLKLQACSQQGGLDLFNGINDQRNDSSGTWNWYNIPPGTDAGLLSNNILSIDSLATGSYQFIYRQSTECGADSAIVAVEIENRKLLDEFFHASYCNNVDSIFLPTLIDSSYEITQGFWYAQPILTNDQLDQSGTLKLLGLSGTYDISYSRPGKICSSDLAGFKIQVDRFLSAGTDGDTSICESINALNLFEVIKNEEVDTATWSSVESHSLRVDNNFFSSAAVDATQQKDYNFSYKIINEGVCPADSAAARVTVYNSPEATLNADPIILCKDSATSIEVNLTGQGPFRIKIVDNKGNSYHPANSVNAFYSFQKNLAATSIFTVTSVEELGGFNCSAINPKSIEVEVYGPIQAKLIREECLLNPDSSFSGFIPVIELSGGDGSNYRYDLFVEGVAFKIGASAPNLLHQLDTLPNGVEYSYRFYDGSNCPDIEAVFNRQPRKYCECATFAGLMDQNPVSFCESTPALLTPAQNAFLEPEDTLFYVLHDRPGIVLGNVLATNAKPEFSYTASLEYNKTYYVSSLAGDSLLGAIDPQDTCVAVGSGTPITFVQLPDISFSIANQSICEGDLATVSYNTVGTAPFTLNGIAISKGDTTPVSYTGLGISGELSFNPIDTTQYIFSSITDGSNISCSNTINISTQVNVRKRAKISFAQDPEVGICAGNNAQWDLLIQDGIGPFRFEIFRNGSPASFSPLLVSGNSERIELGSGGLYTINKVVDLGGNCESRILKGSLTVVEKQQPIANAGASPMEVCGQVANLHAQPSFGVGRWEIPVAGHTFSNPSQAKTFGFVPSPGEYQFVWTEENAPCPVSRDTVFASFYQQPVADAGVDSLFCGTQATLYGRPSVPNGQGRGFWIYDGIKEVSYDNAQSPNSVVTVGSSGSYELVWREEAGGKCVDTDTVNLIFSDFLRAAVVDTICLDNGNKYKFVININGGDPDSLTVNGKLIGELPYITPALNSGQNYKFGFSDLSICGYSDTLKTSYGCPCISDAGEVQNQDTLVACIGDKLLLQHKSDYVKDSDDTLIFVLHTRADDTLGNIIAASAQNGLVTSGLSLIPGKVYYLSRLVGSKSNNNLGINTKDYCLSLSPGMPVMFAPKAQAIITVSNQVCEGQDLVFSLNGNGTGPYTFKLRNTPNGIGTQYSVASGDVITLSYPVGNHTFYISDFKDAGNPCTELLNNRLSAVVKPLPNATITFPSEACRFTDVLFKAQTNGRVTWDFGDGSPELEGLQRGHTYTAAGNYTVTTKVVDKQTGCLREYQNFITIQGIPDASFLINGSADFNTLLCEDDQVFIGASTISPTATYKWFVNGVERAPFNPAFVQNMAGGSVKITLTAITSAGCYAETSQTIKVALPHATLDLPTEVCNRADLRLLFTGANQHVEDFEWIVLGNQATSYSDNPTVFKVDEPSGTNFLTVNLLLTSKEGCERNITKNVRVKNVLANIFAPSVVCMGDTVVVVNNAVNSTKLRYNFGDNSTSTSQLNTIKKLYSAPGTYTITQFVENEVEGCSDRVEKNVRVFPLPTVSDRNFQVCQNTLDTLETGGGVFYKWTPADRLDNEFGSSVRFNATVDSIPQTFVYKVAVTSANNCTDTSTVRVKVVGLDSAFILPNNIDTLLTIGDSVDISLPEITGLNYLWTPSEEFACPNCPTQRFYGLSESEYQVLVGDIYGCTDVELNILLRVNEKQRSLDVPQAFSPNGDGVNDFIYPQGLGVEEYEEFRIYNRYGELVYSGSGKNPRWDGMVNGVPAEVDSYAFVVKAKIYNSRIREVLRGSFDLLR